MRTFRFGHCPTNIKYFVKQMSNVEYFVKARLTIHYVVANAGRHIYIYIYIYILSSATKAKPAQLLGRVFWGFECEVVGDNRVSHNVF